jgi:hypothetical protein
MLLPTAARCESLKNGKNSEEKALPLRAGYLSEGFSLLKIGMGLRLDRPLGARGGQI